jgi:hypothetical protein
MRHPNVLSPYICIDMEINQPISIDVPSMEFVLNYVFLTHKIISWAKKSKQQLVSFRLKISKAYENRKCGFMFQCMGKMGILKEFVKIKICSKLNMH